MSETTKLEGSAEQSGLISVRLGRLLERLDERVEAGDFENRSEAIREGTRRMVLEAEIEEREDEPELVTDGGEDLSDPDAITDAVLELAERADRAGAGGVEVVDAIGAAHEQLQAMGWDEARQADDSHRFEDCPGCGGDLEYQTRQTLTCRTCGEDYDHEKRSDRDLLWSLTDDLELDEVVASTGFADAQEVDQ